MTKFLDNLSIMIYELVRHEAPNMIIMSKPEAEKLFAHFGLNLEDHLQDEEEDSYEV